MMTVFYITKFILKLLLFIVFLPLILCWLFIVYANYKFVLINNLVKSGMPRDMAKAIAKETKPSKMIDFGKFGITKPDAGKVNARSE
ncbi:MAG: hypothetical protein ACYCWE_03135 [Eubacteriales bacterium]